MHPIPAKAYELFAGGASPNDVFDAKILTFEGNPCSKRTARRWGQYYKEKTAYAGTIQTDDRLTRQSAKFEEMGDKAVATSISARIKSVEQLIEACQVDMSLWKVDKFFHKAWEIGRADKQVHLYYDSGKASGEVDDSGEISKETLFRVEAWFSLREEKPFEETVDRLIDRLPSPQWKGTPSKPKGDHLVVPQFYDAHFGKMSVTGETLEQFCQKFKDTVDKTLARIEGCSLDVDRALIVVGQDFLNADNMIGTTTAGTAQEMSNGKREVIYAATDAYLYLIEQYAYRYAVDVAIVPGNHDRFSSYWIGCLLNHYFSKNPRVTIDDGESPRKYHLYGKNLICMTHGNEEKGISLPLLMAVESADKWGAAEHREIHTGHTHKKAGAFYMVDMDKGVSIRVVPALCDTDYWHLLKGFVGNKRTAEVRFYHKEDGPAGSFPVLI